jgi:polyisoprenoid-binding protein YceI
MDQEVQAVMEVSKYPRITFRLDQLAMRNRTNSAAPHLYCLGTLEIHGRTNRIDFPVSLTNIRINQVMAIGATAIRMSDYGIVPPSAPLPGGQDQTEDEVAISFEWIGQRSNRPPLALTDDTR